MRRLIRSLTIKKLVNYLKNRVSYALSLLTRRARVWGMPVALSIEPSAVCTLRCPECVVGAGRLRRTKKFIDFEIFKQTIDQTAETLCYLMLYFQGEPFLAPKIFEMIDYAKQKNLFTAISTNAQNIDQQTAERIVATQLDHLIISLDGTTQESYATYRRGGNIDKVLETIHYINAAKKSVQSSVPTIELQFIVFKHNEHEIVDFRRLAGRLNVQKFSIKSAQIYNFESKENLIPSAKKFSRYVRGKNGWKLKKKNRNRCSRLWLGGVVTSDGAFVPCCFDKNAENLFGNVAKQSVNFIWHSTEANRFRQSLLNQRKSIEICSNCSE